MTCNNLACNNATAAAAHCAHCDKPRQGRDASQAFRRNLYGPEKLPACLPRVLFMTLARDARKQTPFWGLTKRISYI